MTEPRPTESLVLSYLGEPYYHRSHPDDDLRPACRPGRIRGVMAIRIQAERLGQKPCPECWPPQPDAHPAPISSSCRSSR
jgi:hypothetical protein